MPFFSCCTAAQCAAAVLDASVWMGLPLLIYYLAESCLSLFLVALCDGFSPSFYYLLLLPCTTPSDGRLMPAVRHLSRRTGAKYVRVGLFFLLRLPRVTSAHLSNIHYLEECMRGTREVIRASSITAAPPCAFLYRVPVAGVVLDACCLQYSRYTGISRAEMLSPSTPCAQTGVESLLELLVCVRVATESWTFRMGILFSMLMARVPLVHAP